MCLAVTNNLFQRNLSSFFLTLFPTFPFKIHSTSNVLFHGFQGDYEKAGLYYMASVKEVSKPHEFVFPYYGW